MDVVQMAGKHLRARFEKEKLLLDPKNGKLVLAAVAKTKHEDRPAQPNAAERISAFLGEKNWSRRKVSDLLRLSERP